MRGLIFKLAGGALAASRRRGIVTFALPLAVFLIYLRTLAPGVLPGDSGEFQFAAWGWTLSHPTGYPLYLLLGGIWEHLLPIHDPAFRLNLLSAVLSALTIGVSYRVFVQVADHRGAALVAALALAVAPTFWSQATEAEVYALNTLFIALLTRFALKWRARRRFVYSGAWALTFGLALTHHRSIILLIPAFAAFFAQSLSERASIYASIRSDLNLDWLKRDAAYVALVAAPLLLYAYVPLRAPATTYTRLEVSPALVINTVDTSPAGLMSLVVGKSFGSDLDLNMSSLESLSLIPTRLVGEFNPLGLVLGMAGLVCLVYQHRTSLLALTLFGIVGVALFNVSYHIGDIADFYTPLFFLFSVWIAAGLGTAFKFLDTHIRFRGSLVPATALLFITAAIPIQNLSSSFANQDRSLSTQWGERWTDILNSDLPQGAILISNDRDEVTPMWYLQIVKGLRPDCIGLFPLVAPGPSFSNVMRLVDTVIDSGRPVFLVKPMPAISLRYRIENVSPGLFRVAGVSLIPPRVQSDAVLSDKLRVLGFSVVSGRARPDGQVTIAVYWMPLAPLDRDYAVSLQLFDEDGNKITQAEDHIPGSPDYPPSLWLLGETLVDQFTLLIPTGAPLGRQHLSVKVYDSAGEDSLGNLTEIGRLAVNP